MPARARSGNDGGRAKWGAKMGYRVLAAGWVRRLAALLMLVAGAALVSGCLGIGPKAFAGPQCNFVKRPLSSFTPINIQQLAGGQRQLQFVPDGSSPEPTLRDEMLGALVGGADLLGNDGKGGDSKGEERALLFLSGGSLHGAFGAGYLAQWKRNRGHLPRYRVVTGISTGAILGSFAFADMPEIAEEAYGVGSEDTLLKVLVGTKNGSPTFWGQLHMLKTGAIGDLAPLRGYLAGKLSDRVLSAVAAGAAQDRKFYVGVVDVDTGQAVALDMTAMAKSWQEAPAGPAKDRLKGCYVEAIIASSSAPMAAYPVFIDNRMYVDGGMRFGAFADEIGDILPPVSEDNGKEPDGSPRNITFHLLMNGYQKTDSKCGRADPAFCVPAGKKDGADDPDSDAPHKDWSFVHLAFRSNSIAINQVYRFSAERIYLRARVAGVKMTYAQMAEEAMDHRWPGDAMFPGETTCRQAREMDRREADPVQFFPRYMHCIIDYGRQRGGEDFPGSG